MHKLSDKSFSRKVMPFLVCCMVLLLYAQGVSTIVTGKTSTANAESACNTETEQENSEAQSSAYPAESILVDGVAGDGYKQLREAQLKLISGAPELMLQPTISLSPAESTE